MSQVQGPVVLGKIDLSQFDKPSKYSRCACCGHQSAVSVYVRDNGQQLCNDCSDAVEEQANLRWSNQMQWLDNEDPIMLQEKSRQIVDTSDESGCPYCGSYEGSYHECPECGHGQ